MSVSDEQKELGSNLRTEYAALEAYHRSLVHYRFVIVGAYLAGISFLAKAAVEAPQRVAIWACGFALLLTISAWILELRTRTLYRKLGVRGEQIEHEFWGYRDASWYSAMWGCQYKTPPQPSEPNIPQIPGPDIASITLVGPLPAKISRYISHSTALDLLYFGSILAWIKLWLEKLGYPVF